MKSWYVEVTIKYVDDLDEDPRKLWDENYVFVLQAQIESSAKKKAIKLALKEFKQDFDNDFSISDFIITDCYETSNDARI